MSKADKSHSELSGAFTKDTARVDWHDETLWWIRAKRDNAANQIPEWEQLREQASRIKEHVLSQLDTYLMEFEAKALQNGIIVHWAKDAAAHNQIVYDILQRKGIRQMVKSKSMLTEECHLNEYLAEKDIEVIDSDLGERIVQLAKEPPSPIELPCIPTRKRKKSVNSFQNI